MTRRETTSSQKLEARSLFPALAPLRLFCYEHVMLSRLRLGLLLAAIFFMGGDRFIHAEPGDEKFTRAEELLQENKFKEAIEVYEDLIAKHPTYPGLWNVHFNVGFAYYLNGQHDKAIEHFKLVAGQANADPGLKEQCALFLANVYSAKAGSAKEDRDKVLEEAVKAFDDFIKTYGEKSKSLPDALYGKASCLVRLDKLDDAQKTLDEFFKSGGDQSALKEEAKYLLARLYANKARKFRENKDDANAKKYVTEACRLFDEVSAVKEDMVLANEAYFSAGEALSSAGAPAEATVYLRKVRPKKELVELQTRRSEDLRNAYRDALRKGDSVRSSELKREVERSQRTLRSISDGPDYFLGAQQLITKCLFEQEKFDEVVILNRHYMPHFNPEQRKRAAYIIIKALLAKSAIEKGIKEWEDFKQTYPKDKMGEDLLYQIADGLLRGGKFKEVMGRVNEFDTTYPLDPKDKLSHEPWREQILYLASEAAARTGDQEEADKWNKRFLDEYPDSKLATEAVFTKAYNAWNKRDYKAAIEGFKLFKEKFPKSPKVENCDFFISMSLFELKQYDDAIKAFEEFEQKYPKSPQICAVLYTKARAFEAKRDFPKAIAGYERVVKDCSENRVAPYSQQSIGLIYLGQGTKGYDKAVPAFRRLIELYPVEKMDKLFPNDVPMHNLVPTAYFYIAEMLKAQGKIEDAEKAYKEIIEKFPDSEVAPESYIAIGDMFYGNASRMAARPEKLPPEKQTAWKEGMKRAVENYEQVIKRFPKSPTVDKALNQIGMVWFARISAKFATKEETEAYFDGLSSDDPVLKVKILFTQGSLSSQLGDKEKAAKTLGKAFEKAKESNISLPNSGFEQYIKVLEESGQADKAIEVANEWLKQRLADKDEKGIAGANLALGILYFKKGDLKKADEYLQEVIKFLWYDKKPIADFYVIRIMEENKKYDDAIKAYGILQSPAGHVTDPDLKVHIYLRLGYCWYNRAGATPAAAAHDYTEGHGYFIKIGYTFGAFPHYAAEALYMAGQISEKNAVPKNKQQGGGFYGNKDAVGFYNKCIKDFPDSPWAPKCKERLKAIGGP